ncbi:hypothetical protein HOY80DRAFT_907495 [Tuber brumale]|nr:hypothetical protein HOY80DRAFT_907495 [Tuber brumale]
MSNNPATKHSPKYKDFLFDGIVTLHLGPCNKKIEIHKKLLANISLELKKYVHSEGIRLPNEKEEVVTLFTKWAYTGDYAHEGVTPLATDPKKNPWLSLRQHLQLYVFSDKFKIPTLKQLAESKFHTEIRPVHPNGKEDVAGIVMVIGYAYDNLPGSDPILNFLARYASWKFELLRATAEFTQLILTHPNFLQELFTNLKGLSTKPTTRKRRARRTSEHTTGAQFTDPHPHSRRVIYLEDEGEEEEEY